MTKKKGRKLLEKKKGEHPMMSIADVARFERAPMNDDMQNKVHWGGKHGEKERSIGGKKGSKKHVPAKIRKSSVKSHCRKVGGRSGKWVADGGFFDFFDFDFDFIYVLVVCFYFFLI